MSIIRWKTGQDLLNFEREFKRLFDGVIPFGKTPNNDDSAYENSVWSPLTDIVEENNQYVLHIDLPGIEKKDIKINFSNGTLSISGERQLESETKEKNYHRIERSYGKFFRSFDLPSTIKSEEIKADFKNGQLIISVPKAEEVKPKEIPISVN